MLLLLLALLIESIVIIFADVKRAGPIRTRMVREIFNRAKFLIAKA